MPRLRVSRMLTWYIVPIGTIFVADIPTVGIAAASSASVNVTWRLPMAVLAS